MAYCSTNWDGIFCIPVLGIGVVLFRASCLFSCLEVSLLNLVIYAVAVGALDVHACC